MKIITRPPVLIGKGCYGVWRVKVFYFDGRKHEHDYVAFTSTEAKRRYLMEFGRVFQGCMYTEFIKKIPLDKSPNQCYNEDTKRKGTDNNDEDFD